MFFIYITAGQRTRGVTVSPVSLIILFSFFSFGGREGRVISGFQGGQSFELLLPVPRPKKCSMEISQTNA